MAEEFKGYDLSRVWFDWCFENPEKINTHHTALYFFIIDHCNRLGWKDKFGLPMEYAKEVLGIKNYRTYAKTFDDLVEWGFITVIQKSTNQYTSNIIALVKNTKANDEAKSKARSKATHRQSKSTEDALVKNTKANDEAKQDQSQKQVQGSVCIDKPLNLETLKPLNPQTNNDEPIGSFKKFTDLYFEFYEKKIGVSPPMDGAQGNALKQLIAYLTKISKTKDEVGALDGWKFVLDGWGRLDKFYQDQLKISQINSNIANILNQLKQKTDAPASKTEAILKTAEQQMIKRGLV